MILKRTEAKIDDVLNAVSEKEDSGRSIYPGMTYEQGVNAALRWATGETEDHPYPEDEREPESDDD